MGGGGVQAPKTFSLQDNINQVSGQSQNIWNTERQYQPLYQGLSSQMSGQNVQAFDKTLLGIINPGAQQSAYAQSAGNVGNFSRLGAAAGQAIQTANPLIGQMSQDSRKLVTQGMGQSNFGTGEINDAIAGGKVGVNYALSHGGLSNASPLLSQLNSTVNNNLANNGNVTQQELNQVDQTTGSAFAGNGLFNSSNSAGAALLNRDQFSQNRLQQWTNIGQGVQGLNSQNEAQQVSAILGQEGMGLQAGGQMVNAGNMAQNFGLSGLGSSAGMVQNGIEGLVSPNQMNANIQSMSGAYNTGDTTPRIVPQLLGTNMSNNQFNSQGQFAASAANAQLSNQQNAAMMQMGASGAIASASIAASFSISS